MKDLQNRNTVIHPRRGKRTSYSCKLNAQDTCAKCATTDFKSTVQAELIQQTNKHVRARRAEHLSQTEVLNRALVAAELNQSVGEGAPPPVQ